MTNGDYIRQMSDRELAELLVEWDGEEGEYYAPDGTKCCQEEVIVEYIIEWLKKKKEGLWLY